MSFWPCGDVEVGYVTIVLANLLEPGMVRRWVSRGFDSRRSCFALVQSNTSTGVRRRGVGKGPIRLEFQAAFVTGDCLIYGATLSVADLLRALEDERAEGRAIVSVYILDPAALANKFASTPCLFGRMATEADHVTITL